MELVETSYHLAKMIKDLEMQFTLKANQKGINFVLDVDESIPNCLYGDELRLRQIVTNLLNNAIKYTKKGTVSFVLRGIRTGDEIEPHMEVKDTGIGIKKEDMSKIFNRQPSNKNKSEKTCDEVFYEYLFCYKDKTNEKYFSLLESLNNFSANFSEKAFEIDSDLSKNQVISPLSMFATLSIAGACSSNNTQDEILSVLNTNLEVLTSKYSAIYSDSNVTYSSGNNENRKIRKKELTLLHHLIFNFFSFFISY